MRIIEKEILINCPQNKIFEVLKEINQWHTWTPSIVEMSFVHSKSFAKGAQVKIIQPKLPDAVWTITSVIENQSFAWEKKSTGLRITANHELIPSGDYTRVKLQIVYQGFLSVLAFMLSNKLTEEYLEMETKGLRQKCESIKA